MKTTIGSLPCSCGGVATMMHIRTRLGLMHLVRCLRCGNEVGPCLTEWGARRRWKRGKR